MDPGKSDQRSNGRTLQLWIRQIKLHDFVSIEIACVRNVHLYAERFPISQFPLRKLQLAVSKPGITQTIAERVKWRALKYR
jgi:hypothetical protein